MTFEECVAAALRTPGLIAEFDRLQGTNLSCKGTPLEKSIDIACRRPERDAALFVAFVRDAVWDRLEVKSEP